MVLECSYFSDGSSLGNTTTTKKDRMNEYEGNWISTLHVKTFHFLSPQPDEINILDIAHALSMTCRFGGHINRFYSVAEHCVRLQDFVEPKSRLAALLHDSEEAYIPDIPRPIKNRLPEAEEMGTKIRKAILKKYGASSADWKSIRDLDNRLLKAEAVQLGVYNSGWEELGAPIVVYDLGWAPSKAEENFLRAFENIYAKQK